MSEYGERGAGAAGARRSAADLKRELTADLKELHRRSGLSLRSVVHRAKEIGRPFALATISDKLNGRRPLDPAFVEAIVRVCHRPPGEPDPAPWLARLAAIEVAAARERQEQPVARHRVGLPTPVAGAFQPRKDLARLLRNLRGGHTVVLNGLGGVGKTQLAAGAAHRLWARRQLDLLVWVPATSAGSIVTGYARAADVLGLDEDSSPGAAAAFLAWLAEPHGYRWLIVLDDLTDPVDLRGLWPPADNGSTIVTTRRRDAALAHDGRRAITVGLFNPAESLGYLHDRLDGDQRQLVGAVELAADLGHLPLALAQAAAYIKDLHLDCAAYRVRLSGRRLADAVPEPGALPDDYPAQVATTWSLSIDDANRLRPAGLARPVLELAALLGPHDIPAGVFSAEATTTHLGKQHRPGTTPEDALDAISCLHRFSLVGFDETAGTVRVHQILQRAVREATSTPDTAELAVVAADALLSIWPEVERDAAFVQMLRTNTEALLANAGQALWADGMHQVLFRAGNSLTPTGLTSAALAHWQKLLPTAQLRLGAEHPDTLSIRNNLAWSHGRAGDAPRAVRELRELLEVRRRVLGPEHINTLATVHGIAVWLAETDDLPGAIAMGRELVGDYLRVFGADHRDTLNTRFVLANWLGAGESATVAAQEFTPLVEDYQRLLGADHPETLDARFNLGFWLARAGRTEEAVPVLQLLLADVERVLSPEHDDALLIKQLLGELGAGER
jgi:hypothetical protein